MQSIIFEFRHKLAKHGYHEEKDQNCTNNNYQNPWCVIFPFIIMNNFPFSLSDTCRVLWMNDNLFDYWGKEDKQGHKRMCLNVEISFSDWKSLINILLFWCHVQNHEWKHVFIYNDVAFSTKIHAHCVPTMYPSIEDKNGTMKRINKSCMLVAATSSS